MPLASSGFRRQALLERILHQGACAYDELAHALGVSSMTIRRDVDALARDGLVIKTLGGVQLAAPTDLFETDLRLRLSERRSEKRAIARAALPLVAGRQTVFLDGGTTCLELAKLLASERSGLTLVTNSALACLDLGRSPQQNMIVGIGGQYDAASASFVGPTAEENAGKFFVDVAFVSTKGFLPEIGTFESAVATYHIKQIVVRQAARVVLLVDHSKFGQRALSKVLDVAQIHDIVTDGAAPADALRALEASGHRVHRASFSRVRAPATEGPARAS